MRRGQRLWRWSERLHIPVPLDLKANVLGLARVEGVSVAAWGFAIVRTAVDNPEFLQTAMALLARMEADAAGVAWHQTGVAPPPSATEVTSHG